MTAQRSGTRLAHAVYRDADLASDEVERVAALISPCPDDVVVSGATAARLHGLWLPATADTRVEVIVHSTKGPPVERSYNKRRELRARRQHLAPDEVVERHGLRVTSEARTWLDLADRFCGGDLMALGDSALRGSATLAEMDELVRRARHRRGVVQARHMLPLLDARSRSRPESHLRWILLDAGLPTPQINVPVHDALGQWLCEPDLSYEDLRLGIEYNGAHHGEPDRMQKDITRTTDVEDRGGWRIVAFGKVQVFGRPDVVVRRVRTLRAEQASLLSMSGPGWD